MSPHVVKSLNGNILLRNNDFHNKRWICVVMSRPLLVDDFPAFLLYCTTYSLNCPALLYCTAYSLYCPALLYGTAYSLYCPALLYCTTFCCTVPPTRCTVCTAIVQCSALSGSLLLCFPFYLYWLVDFNCLATITGPSACSVPPTCPGPPVCTVPPAWPSPPPSCPRKPWGWPVSVTGRRGGWGPASSRHCASWTACTRSPADAEPTVHIPYNTRDTIFKYRTWIKIALILHSETFQNVWFI